MQYLEAKLKSMEDMPDKFKCCPVATNRLVKSQGLVRRLIFPLIRNVGGIGTCPFCGSEKLIEGTAQVLDMSGFSEDAIKEAAEHIAERVGGGGGWFIESGLPIHICLDMHDLDEVPKEI